MSEKVHEAIDTDEAVNAVPALSPLLPMGRKDVIGTARMMLNKAVQKPRLFGKSVAAFLREEKDILAGNSDHANTILVNVVDNAADDTVLSILGTPQSGGKCEKAH